LMMRGNEQEQQGERASDVQNYSVSTPVLTGIAGECGHGTEPVNTYRHKAIVYNVRHKGETVKMANKSILDLDYAKYDFKDPEKYVFKSEKGLSRQTVEEIAEMEKEPEWMLKFRLRAYEHFGKRPMPMWGGDLAHIDFNDIYYYLRPTDKVEKSWDEVPNKINTTCDRWGIPGD